MFWFNVNVLMFAFRKSTNVADPIFVPQPSILFLVCVSSKNPYFIERRGCFMERNYYSFIDKCIYMYNL